jgi:hypothetical protein
MVLALYPAFFFTVIAIFHGTCTMGSDDSLLAFIFWQAPILLVAIIGLLWARYPGFNYVASIPAVPFIIFYINWSVGLFKSTNINNKSVCTHKMGYEFGLVYSAREYLYAPYSIYVGLFLLVLIYYKAKKVACGDCNNWLFKYKKQHLSCYVLMSLGVTIGLFVLK